MDDHPEPGSDENPLERALRLKKAAIQAKSKPPGGGRSRPDAAAGVAAGLSKPWMKR
jgi:hypothetical protein